MYCLLSAFVMLFVISSSAEDRIGNKMVHLHSTPENWMSAYEACKFYGMQLLTLYSYTEYQEVLTLMKKYKIEKVWIAATDMGHEGNFVWATTGQKVTWMAGKADNYKNNEHCVHIWNEQWNDIDCNTKGPYFCEETAAAPKKIMGNCTLARDDTVSCIFREE